MTNASVDKAEAFFDTYTPHHGILNAETERRGLGLNQSTTMEATISISHLTMDECEEMTHICLLLLDHATASYLELDASDNFLCALIDSSSKVCDPRTLIGDL
jgi:hypothetical protein